MIGRVRGCLVLVVGAVDVEEILPFDVEDERVRVGPVRPQEAAPLRRLEEHVEEKEGIRGLRGDAGDSGDRHVASLLSIDEREVREHAVPRLIHADRQRPLHLIDEERRVALGAGGHAANDGAGQGREPELGGGAEDLDFHSPHRDPGHGALRGDPLRVCRELGALDLACSLDDDPVVGHRASVGEGLRAGHEIVELHEGLVVEDDVEPARRRRHRAVHEADLRLSGALCLSGIHQNVTSRCALSAAGPLLWATASRTARWASRESPRRWRRWFSSAPIGWRFCGARGSLWAIPAKRGRK